jgi:hypothetical protein
MRRIWLVLLVLGSITMLFQGCTKRWEEETVEFTAPNWTSDNKIVFIKDHNIIKIVQRWAGEESNLEGSKEYLTLCEINNNGSGYREIKEICRSEHHALSIGINATSTIGEWVVFDLRDEDDSEHRICVIKRDGTGFNNTGVAGLYPDFSPDAERIVYQKKDEGLWIMNRDGNGKHKIISEGGHPACSPEGRRIAYVSDQLYVADTSGVIIYSSYGGSVVSPDWSASDTNSLMFSSSHPYWILIIHLDTGITDTLSLTGSHYVRWSPNGEQIIEYDVDGYFVINRDGTRKWYLNP